jgi:hypothetical protein
MLHEGTYDEPWKGRKLNQLIFIGKNLDRKELNEGFKQCLV